MSDGKIISWTGGERREVPVRIFDSFVDAWDLSWCCSYSAVHTMLNRYFKYKPTNNEAF